MNEIYFTSDEHYGYSNILKYTTRPFDTVEEMNETIIKKHNDIVKYNDSVYHLGDFTFKNAEQYLNRLNGNHYLLKGNHDPHNIINSGFAWVKDYYELKYNKQYIVLCHFPFRRWNRAHYGSWHLRGHEHGCLEDYGKSCDVGVDAWNLTPVSIDQLSERFKDVENIEHH